MTFDTEKVKFYRTQIERLELSLKFCANTYGIAPCTAAGAVGTECYNTSTTCQDRPNYTDTTRKLTICDRGGIINPGEDVRPYMTKIDTASTEVSRANGIATRGRATVQAIDEECYDHLDPYRATRPAAAGGTFWRRLVARNPNYFGITAKITRGFATEPFSLDAIREEQYIVQRIAGPDPAGRVSITLADRTKLLDNAKAPAPSKGKLSQLVREVGPYPSGTQFRAGLKAHELLVYCQSGGASTVQFGEDAEPIDHYYIGFEVMIIDGTGAGQQRVITSYTGETRLAGLSSAWEVVPNSTSVADLSALSLTIDDASSYASSGYVALGDEVIRYTSKVGNTLYWPGSEYREQFGTERIDHDAGAKVQQCLVYEDAAPYTVLADLLGRGGIDGSLIAPRVQSELESWAVLGRVTACVMAPEVTTKLIGELCEDWNLDLWWDAVQGLVDGKCNAPEQLWGLTAITDDEMLLNKTAIDRMDDARITQAATDYAIRSASAGRDSAESYLVGELLVDSDAEDAAEFGDVRQSVRRTRWMGAGNALLVRANTARKLLRLRNVPIKFAFHLDYRNELDLGQLIIVRSRYLVGFDGEPRSIKCKITKIDDMGTGQAVEAMSAFFSAKEDDRRFGFVAPAGLNNYTTATAEQQAKYCWIGDNAALMSNGDEGYYIS